MSGNKSSPVDYKETEIERMVLDFLSYKRLFVWKNPSAGFFDTKKKIFRRHSSPFAINGTPDVFAMKRRKDGSALVIAIEVKTRLGRLSDAQIEFRKQYEAKGGLYFVVRSLEDAEAVYMAIQEL